MSNKIKLIWVVTLLLTAAVACTSVKASDGTEAQNVAGAADVPRSITVIGQGETWPLVLKTVKQTHLNLRVHVIVQWLTWLQQVNPEFANVDIPDPANAQQMNEIRQMLEGSVQRILHRARTTDSGRVYGLAEYVRSEAQDQATGIEDELEGIAEYPGKKAFYSIKE